MTDPVEPVRTAPYTFMLPRRWGVRIEERVRRGGYDDASAWVRYHLQRALDAPIDPIPEPRTWDERQVVARRLTDAITTILQAAKLLDQLGASFADADGRRYASELAVMLRDRGAELAQDPG